MNKSDNYQNIDKLILDTHVLLWYVEGIQLKNNIINLIDSKRHLGKVFISSISIWEIALLSIKGKIVFSIPVKEWIDQVLSTLELKIIELKHNILIESCELLNYPHKDPADRMIIASARETNAHLLTADKKIIDYHKQGYLKAVEI
ncbi:MAG: type II toxin-antitoxin system VapC family toxin [Rickettsiaceae bacterium]|nr:type II toxin-antitoxin system VapC family toxin [Rickettsiaceae bacterium]